MGAERTVTMFVLTETYNTVQNSDSPMMGIVLAVALVVIAAFGIWAIIDAWKGR